MVIIQQGGVEDCELEGQLKKYANSTLIVKVSGKNLERNSSCDLEMVCSGLASMQGILQKVNAGILVVHGAGQQLDKAIEAAGLQNRKVEGLRYTDDGIYEVVENEVSRIKKDVVEMLRLYGGEVLPMPKAFVIANGLGPAYGGRVGKPSDINRTLLGIATNGKGAKPILVVSSLGVDHSGKTAYNINADDVEAILVSKLKPTVSINVTSTGGILADASDKKSVIPRLSIQEAEKLSMDGMAVKVKALKSALEASPETRVIITSPADMVYSLFRTSGTTLTYN